MPQEKDIPVSQIIGIQATCAMSVATLHKQERSENSKTQNAHRAGNFVIVFYTDKTH